MPYSSRKWFFLGRFINQFKYAFQSIIIGMKNRPNSIQFNKIRFLLFTLFKQW